MRAQTVKKQILQKMIARDEPIRACNITASNDTLLVKYKKVLFSEKLIVEGIVF